MREVVNLIVWSTIILILLYEIIVHSIVITKYIFKFYRIGKVENIEKKKDDQDELLLFSSNYELTILLSNGDEYINIYSFNKPPYISDTIKLVKIPFEKKLKIVDNKGVLFRLLFLFAVVYFFVLVWSSTYISVVNSFILFVKSYLQ